MYSTKLRQSLNVVICPGYVIKVDLFTQERAYDPFWQIDSFKETDRKL